MSTDGGAGRRRRVSIRDYITDGSLAALCAELASLTGSEITLRDERGELIESAGAGRLVAAGAAREGEVEVPLLVEGARIGSIVMRGGPADDEAYVHTRSILSLLGRAASELCADVSELRGRVKELGVLERLSSLLVGGGDPEDVLRESFESALDVLGLDAGSLVLLPEDADGIARSNDESELEVKASRGLSEGWLSSGAPLSRERVFDRQALDGEVVVSEDLLADPRVVEPGRCVEENLRSFIGAGLVVRGRPIGVMRLYSRTVRAFSEADRRLLRSIGQQGAAAVEQARLVEARARERRVKRQLQLAGAVQARMLPTKLPTLSGLDIAARCEPSSDLGGDFFDVFELGGRVVVLIGDVVGKGIAAALLMSAVRATLRAYLERVDDLSRVMSMANEALCRDSLPNEFATVWLGLINPETGELTYCSAGHDPPFVVRDVATGSPRLEELPGDGLVLGVLGGEVYPARTVRLREGDVVFAYTDGVTDAASFDRKRFGRARLHAGVLELLGRDAGASASRVLDQTMWHVRAFSGLAERADDETAVVVRVGAGFGAGTPVPVSE